MKLNVIKLVVYSIASILFTLFIVFFLINSDIFRADMPTYFVCYQILYLFCLIIVDTLFIVKIVEYTKKVFVNSSLQARKATRQEAKAEKAQATKQAKISELEKQLEELKNN